MSYNVAVVGATGAVGREMLQTLAERKFPAAKVLPWPRQILLAERYLMVKMM